MCITIYYFLRVLIMQPVCIIANQAKTERKSYNSTEMKPV